MQDATSSSRHCAGHIVRTRMPGKSAPANPRAAVLAVSQYRQADSTALFQVFYSTKCLIQNVIIRYASLTAVVDYYGQGGNTYS